MTGLAERYSTKSDFAYMLVRDKILSRDYAPGVSLNQAMLARDLGISTTPLREALRRLKSEGLIELDAHRDARVARLSAEEARDLIEVRLALDPMAVALAADRRTTEDIAEMRSAAAELAETANRGVDLSAHRRFHRAVYAASHNDVLIATLDTLWDKADRYRSLGLAEPHDPAHRQQTAAEHERILLSVIAGDAAGASAVMRQHVQGGLGVKAAFRLGSSGKGGRHDIARQPGS